LAKQKGASEEQVAGVKDFEKGPFSEREKLGFRCADRLHLSAENIDDDFFTRLEGAFSRQEIIELIAAAAAFEFFTRFVDALRIPITPSPASTDRPRK
jgi:alkylhydroperoxidase family enzyme